jgi:hypothetical protein
MRTVVMLIVAAATWLALTRLPVDGALLFLIVGLWGLLFGAALRHWLAGPVLLATAVLVDLVALAIGGFSFLADFWFIPPMVGALAGLLGGALAQTRAAPATSAQRTGSNAH